MHLSDDEIRRRLVRLRNLEMLHGKARERIVFLEAENGRLKKRIKELEDNDRDKNAKIEAMSFQLEQIKIKVFGKKPEERIVRKRKRTRSIGAFIATDHSRKNGRMYFSKKTSRFPSKRRSYGTKWKLGIAPPANGNRADIRSHRKQRCSARM